MAPICDTRPQQVDGHDLFSRFRDMKCPGPLVSRIREMPNPEKPKNSLIETFPEIFDLCHVSLKYGRLRFHDFPNLDVPMALSSSGLFPSRRICATRPG
jgi:hypothetical protein